MSDLELRFRQIHLDFHTSEAIDGIGADFDPDEFADTLARAHVDSINIFGRGHHGWMYFESEKFPQRVHPHLVRRNLLGDQIEALHKRDIKCPIYLTIQWDNYSAMRRPEWRVMTAEGGLEGTPPYEPGFYNRLCVNTPYRQFLAEHFVEVLEKFDPDGLWLDIVFPLDCSCRYCQAGMVEAGLDRADAADRMQYAVEMLHNWKRETAALIRSIKPDCLIFFNAGHIGPRVRAVKDAYTHWELESLPSGGWGYMHFPSTQRYARTLGLDSLGMTGKFHTTWGDFHSFKNRPALEFECFMMLALNAKCGVGDQLHPTGKICPVTYDLIGSVYEQVEAKEPWCRLARPLVDIAVMTPEAFGVGGSHTSLSGAIMGAVRMLQEGAHQFDVIDAEANFSDYRLVVLPDEIPVSPELAQQLDAYVADGGSLIATGRSGLNETGDAFALDALGLTYKGDAPYSPDFIVPEGDIGKALPSTGHVIYMQGTHVEPAGDAVEVLARVEVPYFNRTWDHYCSHNHTPTSFETGYPAIIRNGRAIYFIHPIFSQYNHRAPLWCKRLLLNAVDILLPNPLVRLEAPSSTVATLNAQPAESRQVLHLLHYIPERRGTAFDVIEDIIPILDVKVSVRAGQAVASVMCVPQEQPLEFTQADGCIEFTLPRLTGHQMIALNFA